MGVRAAGQGGPDGYRQARVQARLLTGGAKQSSSVGHSPLAELRGRAEPGLGPANFLMFSLKARRRNKRLHEY